MRQILQCMGVRCKSREICAHYHAPQINSLQPSERICGDVEEPKPIRELDRDAEFRAQIMADPRFAAWVAGQKS